MPPKNFRQAHEKRLALFTGPIAALETCVFRTQDVVQFFDQSKEPSSILFLIDKRTEFANPFTVCFIHSD